MKKGLLLGLLLVCAAGSLFAGGAADSEQGYTPALDYYTSDPKPEYTPEPEPPAAQPPAPAIEVSGSDELDKAIREASDYLNKNVPRGTKLVILNIKSSYPPLSEYIVDVLTGNVVNDRIFTVVDRANLALIQQELDFHLSGEVSDESAQSIGKKLGAQTIVSGSITNFGNLWRLTIRALGVESATIQGMFNRNMPHGASIAALTGGSLATPGPAAPARQGQTSSGSAVPAAPKPSVYKVGDKGPAGGWIFYDKGNNFGGWRYLEAAPAGTEFKSQWGLYGIYSGGTESTEVGKGKVNTQSAFAAFQQSGEVSGAARYCTMLKINGYSDWFLPSRDELYWMYVNLKEQGIGGFSSDWYWSSSQHGDYGAHGAWTRRFGNGSQGPWHTKTDTLSVRAVRAF